MEKEQRIELNAFVVMSNHVHIIWQPQQQFTLTQIQSSFMTQTAKAIKKKLALENPYVLEQLRVNKYEHNVSPPARRAGDMEARTVEH